MSVWSRAAKFAKRLLQGKNISGRDLQLRTETLLLYSRATGSTPIATDYSSNVLSHAAELLTSESGEIPSFETQVSTVQKYLFRCMLTTLRSTEEIVQDDETMEDIEERIKEKHGFVPKVLRSSIPDAGKGLHIEGKAKAGTLIALYPGTCYMPSDLKWMPNYPEITKNNDYLIWRYDGIVIDGKDAIDDNEVNKEPVDDIDQDVPVAMDQEEDEVRANEDPAECVMHPFCYGHMANHPPPRVAPNCLQFMFNMPMRPDLKGLHHLIPNAYYSTPKGNMLERLLNIGIQQRVPSVSSLLSTSTGYHAIPTLMLIATRDLEDEEVFMNYRFNPNANNIPSWYHDCDPESSKRRWKDTGILFSS